MRTLADIRKQYPQYANVPDDKLATALHDKFYAQIPTDKFNAAIGFSPSGFAATQDATKRAANTPAALRSATNGATLGLANLVDAGGAAAETGLYNLFHPGKGKYGMAQAFNAVRQADNDSDRQFAQTHPVTSGGLGLLGGLAMPGGGAIANFVKGSAPAAVVAKGILPRVGQAIARTAPVAARSAVVGAGLGGVAGAAAADPGKELAGAQGGVVTGGLTGLAVPIAGRVASGVASSAPARTVTRALSKASGALGGPQLDPTRQAGLRLSEAMTKDGATPDQVRAVANEWLAKGVTPTLIDAVNNNGGGQNTMALIRGAAMKSGGARNIMATHDRQVGADLIPNAMKATAALTPGDAATAEQAIAARTAARSARANTDYAPAYATPVQPTPEVAAALQDSFGNAAIKRAQAGATARQDYGQAADIGKLAGGAQEPVSAGALDRVRIALREASEAAGRGDNPARDIAAGLAGRSQQIDSALSQVPEMAPARQAFADASRGIDAVDLGHSGLQPRTIPADYSDTLSQLRANASDPADISAAAQTGFRSAIEQNLGNAKPGVAGPLNTLRNTNNRAILSTTFGDDVAGHYDSVLDKLSQQRQNASALNPNTGSQTGVRAEDAGFSLHPKSWIPQIVDGLRNGMTLTDGERDALAKLATTQANSVSLPQATPEQAPAISSGLSQIFAPYLARQEALAQ